MSIVSSLIQESFTMAVVEAETFSIRVVRESPMDNEETPASKGIVHVFVSKSHTV